MAITGMDLFFKNLLREEYLRNMVIEEAMRSWESISITVKMYLEGW